MGLYRMAFGVTVTLFINPWINDIGTGWAYGMMSFFTIVAFALVLLLILKGQEIRQSWLAGVSSSEKSTRTN